MGAQSKYFSGKKLCENKPRVPVFAGVQNNFFKENTKMKTTNFTKIMSFILCIVLVAGMALFIIGCNDGEKVSAENTDLENAEYTELGEGECEFIFTVRDAEGANSFYKIKTDKKTVGEALIELGLIEGEEGPYGIYVKTVCGMTYSYENDGKYWAFYENDAYAMAGAEVTEIAPDTVYSFRVE